jgi:hypothetical protein
MTIKDIIEMEDVLFFYGDIFMDNESMHYWPDSGWLIVSPAVCDRLNLSQDGNVDKDILSKKPEIMFGDIYKTAYAHFLPKPEDGIPLNVITID